MKNTLKVKMIPNSDNYIIEMDKTFAKNAENTNSAEYKKLQEVRLEYPDSKIVVRHIKKNPDQERYNGLTYKFMEDYIRCFESKETVDAVIKEFTEMRLISECHSRAFRYPTIKQWFLNKYPDVKSFVSNVVAKTAEIAKAAEDVQLTAAAA